MMHRLNVILIPLLLFQSCGETQFSDGSSSGRQSSTATEGSPSSENVETRVPEGADADAAGSIQPTPTNPSTDIEFGADVVYHIGDGEYEDSSCLAQIDTYPMTGSKFYFEFDILEDDTDISVSLNTVCGVDYENSNEASIMPMQSLPATGLGKKLLLRTDSSVSLQTVTLKTGKYAVLVEAKPKPDGLNKGDHDDFIVGKIHVRANKHIIPGSVTTKP